MANLQVKGSPAPTSNVQTLSKTQTAPVSPVTPPSTSPAPSTLAPQDQHAIANSLGTANTEVQLDPPPPALMKVGANNPESKELNKLLKNIGYLKTVVPSYTTDTESAIRQFQKNNGLQETGELDQDTLSRLLEASKEDDRTYPKLEAVLKKAEANSSTQTQVTPPKPVTPKPVQPTPVQPNPPKPEVKPEVKPEPAPVSPPVAPTYANDYERVKDMVAQQLIAKGIDPEKSFAIGGQLKDAAVKWDRKMPSDSMCFTAVKSAIDDAINIPYQVFGPKGHPGRSAKNAGKYLFSKSPEFVKLEGLKRSDLDNLPAGAVIVYKPGKGHGHIGVQSGAGQDISDKTRTQANVYKNADFDVYFPVAVRGQK